MPTPTPVIIIAVNAVASSHQGERTQRTLIRSIRMTSSNGSRRGPFRVKVNSSSSLANRYLPRRSGAVALSHCAFSAPQILHHETEAWRQGRVNHWVAQPIRQLLPRSRRPD